VNNLTYSLCRLRAKVQQRSVRDPRTIEFVVERGCALGVAFGHNEVALREKSDEEHANLADNARLRWSLPAGRAL